MNKRKWAAFRREIFERDGWRCVKCGGAGRLECHHPHKLEHGGAPFDPANAETLCRECHVREHNPPRPGVAAWRALVHDILSS
ncbi:MAG: HNH endonuclease [Nitrospinae bacterium]|nr:HNH endonuclease [Nitrospinota bacterium]